MKIRLKWVILWFLWRYVTTRRVWNTTIETKPYDTLMKVWMYKLLIRPFNNLSTKRNQPINKSLTTWPTWTPPWIIYFPIFILKRSFHPTNFLTTKHMKIQIIWNKTTKWTKTTIWTKTSLVCLILLLCLLLYVFFMVFSMY